MTDRWLILADDLTGAADCAIAFGRRGHAAAVMWGEGAADHDLAVLSWDAASRGLSADAAASRHVHLLARLFRPNLRLFKKIDSTLRGQPAAEIAATLAYLKSVAGTGFGVFAPAFPATGRTTIDGHILVKGRPLEQTETWQRDHTYANADLVDVLATSGIRGEHIRLAAVRGGDLEATFAALAARGDVVAACDAETEHDLHLIAQASLKASPTTLFIGSAGLAHALAGLGEGEVTEPLRIPRRASGTLIVVGSLAGASRSAARELVATGAVAYFPVVPGILLMANPGRKALASEVTKLLSSGGDVLVEIVMKDEPDMSLGPKLAQGLADTLAPVAPAIGGLAATGGETAAALLQRFGVNGIRLADEIEPGVSLGLTLGENLRPDCHQGWRVRRRAEPDPHPRTAARRQEQGKFHMSVPTIAITMGDPAGIGAEVIMKALAQPVTQSICNALVIGDAGRLRKAGKIVGQSGEVDALDDASEANFASKAVQCVDLKLVPDDLPFGKVSAVAGEAAYRYIEKAVQVVQAGKAQAICTAPLSKEALHAAGHKYPGHTELLAHLTGTPEVSMMLVSPKLRVIHVTTHIGLLDAIARIEPGLVERVIARGHEVLVRAGIAKPKIGVCAINPHAGENGLFGHGEEAAKITPAVEACQRKGLGRARSAAGRYAVLPRRSRRLRHGGRDVSRSGPWSDQGVGAGSRRQHHRRPSGYPHLGRSRHGVRHRRPRHRRRAQPDRGTAPGRRSRTEALKRPDSAY